MMKKLLLILTIACLASCSKQSVNTINVLASGNIITVAGNGVYGYSGDGGRADSAQLNFPGGVALDASGNLYIADNSNNRIRKVSASGIITTIAGNGTLGYSGDGGQATSASLKGPSGVAVDKNGNVYIADANNNVIRMVNASGIIITFAGKGLGGFDGDGGLADSAKLCLPAGVAVDDTGNVYIADMGNQRVRKVNTSGIITTVAGNGTGAGTSTGGYAGDGGAATSAELNGPIGVTVDGSGNIYIADYNNNVVRKVNASGNISTIAGNHNAAYSGDSSAATSASLHFPQGVAVDGSGNIYIADSYNQRIRRVNSAGIITTYAGNGNSGSTTFPTGSYGGDGGPAISALLFNPSDVAVDAAGNVYIADQQNNRIRKVNK